MFYNINMTLSILFIGLYCCVSCEGNDQMIKNNGSFLVYDKSNNAIILEWERIVGKNEKLDEKIKAISHLLIPTYARQEVEFARECSDMKTSADLKNDFMLKSLAPLFDQGKAKVDWKLFETTTHEVLQKFFSETNWAQYSGNDDITVFVTAIDQKTDVQLGVIQLLSMPAFAQNNIKIGLFGVVDAKRNDEIKQLLISSVFTLFPDAVRLFLHTRLTDMYSIALYQSWGFVQFAGKLPHWTDLEYVISNADILQKVALGFEVKS